MKLIEGGIYKNKDSGQTYMLEFVGENWMVYRGVECEEFGALRLTEDMACKYEEFCETKSFTGFIYEEVDE